MHSEIVDTVKGASEVSFYGHAAIQTIGKQDYYPGCLLDLNLDFARWCSSGITPDGKLAPWNSCEYCYSSHMHTGYPAAFAVEKDNLIAQIKEARIAREAEGKPTRYMRLGKRTECGSPIFRKNLINTLEACAEEGIKCIFPTKFLEFDKEVAKLLKKTDSTLLVSLGSNELEPGAVLHGRTQEARIAEGIKYLEAGIRVVPYVIVDAALPNGGKYFEKNLAEAKEKFPRIQILPIRLRHRERAVKILGGWHDLLKSNTGQLDLFGKPDGKYESGGDHTRIAVDIHSSLTDLINNNCGSTRMCHHSSCAEYCGMCFMPGEKPFSRKV